jgi:hypothetical protein
MGFFMETFLQIVNQVITGNISCVDSLHGKISEHGPTPTSQTFSQASVHHAEIAISDQILSFVYYDLIKLCPCARQCHQGRIRQRLLIICLYIFRIARIVRQYAGRTGDIVDCGGLAHGFIITTVRKWECSPAAAWYFIFIVDRFSPIRRKTIHNED